MRWGGVIVGVDADPANAESIKTWTEDYFDELHPYSAGGAYVNLMMDEGEERVQASYRDHYDRLAEVKAAYDPDNVFHINQNIRPSRPDWAAAGLVETLSVLVALVSGLDEVRTEGVQRSQHGAERRELHGRGGGATVPGRRLGLDAAEVPDA